MQDANSFGQAHSDGSAPLGIILIVDDDQTSATALDLACAGIPGTDVRTAFSALEAVRILQDRDAPVRAVVTDIRMPILDGFQLIEFIRAHSRHAATPIIVVTADTDPETPGRISRLGGNACFSKPFSPGAVRRTVERLLHANRTSD